MHSRVTQWNVHRGSLQGGSENITLLCYRNADPRRRSTFGVRLASFDLGTGLRTLGPLIICFALESPAAMENSPTSSGRSPRCAPTTVPARPSWPHDRFPLYICSSTAHYNGLPIFSDTSFIKLVTRFSGECAIETNNTKTEKHLCGPHWGS